MNSKLLYFVCGLVIGSVGSYIALRAHFEKDMETEIAQVKEAFERSSIHTEKEDPHKIAKQNSMLKEAIMNKELYRDYVKETTRYNLFSNPPNPKDIHNGIDDGEDLEIFSQEYEEEVASTPPSDGLQLPYVLETDDISTASEKFVNENPYFDKVTLFYYDDGILTDEDGSNIIEDISALIGEGSLERIGEFEEDVVYERNERYGADYEVIHHHRPFAIFPDEMD